MDSTGNPHQALLVRKRSAEHEEVGIKENNVKEIEEEEEG
jgi:hypothetical protein